MKTLLSFLVVIGVLCCCTTAEKARKCHDESHCDEGECCIVKGINFFVRGKCGKFSLEGESCAHVDDEFDGKFFGYCPCVAGLSCEPEEVEETRYGPLKKNERCVANTVSTTPVGEETTAQSEVEEE